MKDPLNYMGLSRPSRVEMNRRQEFQWGCTSAFRIATLATWVVQAVILRAMAGSHLPDGEDLKFTRNSKHLAHVS